MFRPLPLLLGAPLALSLLAGCASDESDLRASSDVATESPEAADAPASTEAPESTDKPTPGEPVVVTALDNSFRLDELTITAGTEVRFENVGRNDHDVQPVEGTDWGVAVEEFAPGDVYSHVFDTPGTYEYICTIHGVPGVGMIGSIVVTG